LVLKEIEEHVVLKEIENNLIYEMFNDRIGINQKLYFHEMHAFASSSRVEVQIYHLTVGIFSDKKRSIGF